MSELKPHAQPLQRNVGIQMPLEQPQLVQIELVLTTLLQLQILHVIHLRLDAEPREQDVLTEPVLVLHIKELQRHVTPLDKFLEVQQQDVIMLLQPQPLLLVQSNNVLIIPRPQVMQIVELS